MVSFNELIARVKQEFGFNRPELQGLIVSILVTGFIFSFKDWGVEQFDLLFGLKNLLLTVLAAAFILIFHVVAPKIYGLSCGYKMEFRPWWLGIFIALVLTFISSGTITLVFTGSFILTPIIRQRMGQFRFGHLHDEQAIAGFWAILGALIPALLFRIFGLAFPEVLFFEKGFAISLVLAICSVLPLPQLAGLVIFAGWQSLFYLSLIIVLIITLLLTLAGFWGLIISIIIGLISAGLALLWASEI